MRNFDERMEEIRARSKARIAHRRKMIAAVGMPLVLCLVLSVVWFSAGNQIANPVTLETTPTTLQHLNTVTAVYVIDESTGEILCPAGSSEAFLAYVSKLTPDSNRTQQYDATLYGFVSTTGAPAAALTHASYSISVTDAQGNTVDFQLRGTILCNSNTAEVYMLNSAEYKKIKEILCLDAFMNGE